MSNMESQHPAGSGDDAKSPTGPPIEPCEIAVTSAPDDSAEREFRELEPLEQKAMQLFDFSRRRIKEDAERRRKDLLQNEGEVLRMAAERLTGVAVDAGSGDHRHVIRVHLQDFMSAIPMPPGLSPSLIASYQRDAVVMLLRLDPRDDLERMLVSQMIASHFAAMECFRAATSVAPKDRALHYSLANKMMGAFQRLEASYRKRRPSSPPTETEYDMKEFAGMLLDLLQCEGIDVDAWPGHDID